MVPGGSVDSSGRIAKYLILQTHRRIVAHMKSPLSCLGVIAGAVALLIAGVAMWTWVTILPDPPPFFRAVPG